MLIFGENPIWQHSQKFPSVLSYRILYFRISPNLTGGIQFRDALRPIVREEIYLMNRNVCYLFLMIMDSWRHEKRLSYKLRCYKRISSPVKSRNNTREKISYFFHVFDIANQLLTRHSPFAPLDQVDEWTVKPSRFSIQGRLSKFFRIMAAKTLKNLYRSQAVTLELS